DAGRDVGATVLRAVSGNRPAPDVDVVAGDDLLLAGRLVGKHDRRDRTIEPGQDLVEDRVLVGLEREQRLAAGGIDAGHQRVVGPVLVEHEGRALAHVALLHRLADICQCDRAVDVEELAVLAQHVEELAKILIRHRRLPAGARKSSTDVYLHLRRKRRSLGAAGPASGAGWIRFHNARNRSAMTDVKQPMGDTGFRFIGKPIVRKEDERLTTGHGRFSDDFSLAGQAHAVMVRSPHPHARIRAIDAARAKAMPGVLGILTGADCLADGLGAIPPDPLPKTRYDMKLSAAGGGAVFIGPHLLLPADKARHVGEAVAMVLAESVPQALDAAETVVVDYEILPRGHHSQGAMPPGRPAMWDEVPDNVPVDTLFGDRAA